MKPKNSFLAFTFAASFGLGFSQTASAQTTYTLPTTTGAWNWTSSALGGTGWVDDSSATGSIADLRGWNGGSAAATITSSQSRLAYQLIMDQADAGGRRVLGGGSATSNLTLGAGGIVNAATSSTTVDVRTQVTIGANQAWEAGLGGNNTLIMDFRPSSSDATKLNLNSKNLTIGDRVSLQFDLGNTVTSPYAFIGSGGTITAGGSGNTGVIGIGSQELQNNETLDLTGATLAVTSANTAAITFGRGGQTGTLIKIDGLSGTSALSTSRGGVTFNVATTGTTATTTTVQLVGSGNYTIDARIRDSGTPIAGTSLLIQQTGSGTQTFAGAGTAATGGASWNSTAALQVDNGKFIISGDKNGTGLMTVNTGTLIVTGTASGATTVNGGGTLGGNGTVAAITLAGGSGTGGVLKITNDINANLENLNASSLIWNGTTDSAFSQMKFDLGSGGSSDQLVLSGAMTKGTGSIFEWDFGGTGAEGGVYDLLTFTSNSGFSASDFSFVNLASGLTAKTDEGFTNGFKLGTTSLQFATFSAIPEPTSALAGLLIGAGLLRRRRA